MRKYKRWTNVVERLRHLADCDARAGEPLGKCMRDAAAEIERLRIELDEACEQRCKAEHERDVVQKENAAWAHAATIGDGSPMVTPEQLACDLDALISEVDRLRKELGQ